MPAERVKKNHMLNNLVEVYLSQHPGLFAHKSLLFGTKRVFRNQDLLMFAYKVNKYESFSARLLIVIKKGVLLQLKFGIVGVGINIYLWAR